MTDQNSVVKKVIAGTVMSILILSVISLGGSNLLANAQVEAQLNHSYAISKGCTPNKIVGETTDCDITVFNIGFPVDEANDTWILDEVADFIDKDDSGTINAGDTRVPGAGSLPITAVSGLSAGNTCNGDSNNNGLLDGGETFTFPCTMPAGSFVTVRSNQYVIQQNDPDPLRDIAQAIGRDQCDGTPDQGCDLNTPVRKPQPGLTNLIDPSTTLEKTADPPIGSDPNGGLLVTFTFTETNTGDTPLANVQIDDPVCDTLITRQADDPGDNDDLLEPGETWVFTCTANLTQDTVNTAFASGDICVDDDGTTCITTAGTITGDPNDQQARVFDPNERASASVNFGGPGTFLEKTVDKKFVQVGEVVTYTYKETSDRDVNLSDVSISDDQCSPVTFPGDNGDNIAGIPDAGNIPGDDGDGILETNETWTFQCERSYNFPEAELPKDVINIAQATGFICLDGAGFPADADNVCVSLDGSHTVADDPDQQDEITITVLRIPPPCTIQTAEDLIDMNTVTALKFFKTVHKEKEICLTEDGFIIEKMIYAEIISDLTKLPTDPTVKRLIKVITCEKLQSDASVIDCTFKSAPKLGVIVENCISQRVEHPQEMNTVVGIETTFVKTTIANKEVFTCTGKDGNPPGLVKEVVIFMEIFEDLNLLDNSDNQIIRKQFTKLVCVKDPLDTIEPLKVLGCKFSRIK